MAAGGDYPSPDPKRGKQRFTYESEELVESDWMDETKGRAKNRPARKRNSGILRADSSAGQRRGSASSVDFRFDHLNPQAGRASPLPSVDRLSVSFVGERDVSSITSSAPNDNLDWPTSPHFAEDDDEEYSISASAILQRRKSGRRSGRRRPSSPFLADEQLSYGRRRASRGLSVATISSGETMIPMEEINNEEQINQQLGLHKEVVHNMRYQPWDMGRKLRVLRRAKSYVSQHEGALQQRLAEARTAKDILARGQLLVAKFFQTAKRELFNLASFLVPWEARIKEIESLFGSAVASYFTFLRWVFWINLVITVGFTAFVVVPEVLAAEWDVSGERKGLLPQEQDTATDLQTLWDFEGILKYSPIFYGFYSNRHETKEGYKLPFAYFFTGIVLYIYSFVAILRKMAQNSRLSKLSDKEDECTFTWKLFTGWDFMIGHSETAENRRSAITVGFKEALLEEKEKEREKESLSRNVILRRVAANFLILCLLASSIYAVILVVERSTGPGAEDSWWRQNEITVVLSLISILFPNFFELVGLLEQYHPRRQLRWQLARIMVLNMLNLYTLIFALFGKVNTMTARLSVMKYNISQRMPLMDLTTGIPILNDSYATVDAYMPYDNVTETIVSIINATESIDMEPYASGNDTFQLESNATDCYQVAVDCSSLTTPTTVKSEIGLSTNAHSDERRKRQIIRTEATSPPPSPGSSPSIARLLESLNSLLKGFQRNTTRRSSRRSTTASTASTTKAVTETTTLATTTSAPSNEWVDIYVEATTEEAESTTGVNDWTSSPEYINDEPDFTSSWTTIGTEEEANTTEDDDVEPASSNSSSLTTSSTASAAQCYITVCAHNDTSSRQTVNDTAESTTLPCRGDNPQGCTAFWTSMRNTESTVQSSHATQALEMTTPKPTLDPDTRLELRKLCWETMFGQELVKLTVMDLVFTIISIMIIDFIRAVFVRIFNGCWFWDLEKYFPQYGEFKIAENILHLVNNQGMIWMGMFFSPGLPAINIFKLFLLLYVRSWAVLTCNVPHEVIFRASRSNNFYFWLLLMMLFLCTLPVAYAIVWLEPSWHCGPFSDYARIFHVLTQNLQEATPEGLHWLLSYIASPGIVIPLLVLLILVIYYLVSLSSSLRETVNDMRTQMRQERDAERMKNRQNQAAASGNADATAPQETDAAAKIIAQWRKAAPLNKTQQAISQTLAREAVDKRNAQTQGDKTQPPAGSDKYRTPLSPPQSKLKSKTAPSAAVRNKTKVDVVDMEADYSDLDVCESLPNDNSAAQSPVLTTSRRQATQQPYPIYAVVKKKTTKKDTEVAKGEGHKPAVASKPGRSKMAAPAAGPTSPVDIPLIKISKTESIDLPDDDQSAVDGQDATAAGERKKQGALNLILQRARQRKKQQQQQTETTVQDQTKVQDQEEVKPDPGPSREQDDGSVSDAASDDTVKYEKIADDEAANDAT